MKNLFIIITLLILCISCNKINDVVPQQDTTQDTINKIFFFGSSHTDAGQFGKYTAQELNYQYSQCAKNGARTVHFMNTDSINKMVAFNPDIIVIRIGINDLSNSSLITSCNNYNKLLSMIREKTNKPIIIVDVTKVLNADLELSNKIIDFNNFLKTKSNYVDLYNNADYNYIYPDLLHFYPQGYKQQGIYTASEIKKYLNL